MDENSKLRKLKLLQEKAKIQEGLPHLYGFPFYTWMREYFESENKNCLLRAANQIGKSSIQIRKHIHWATSTEKWKHWWRTPPRQFLYLYPSRDVATIEFEKKWIPEFMPRREYKDHPKYGWNAIFKYKQIHCIHWHSGVTTYFKTYMQDLENLQTSSPHKIDTDEEMPYSLWPEINMRRAATDGYFGMVYTPTLGEPEWRDLMEGRGGEFLQDSWRKTVSLRRDCLVYEDGSPSIWTPERIKQLENQCGTQAEAKRRLDGENVAEGGLKYPSFDKSVNVKPPTPIPHDWMWYVGVDIGGGGTSHPGSIVFLVIAPDGSKGRIVKGWRGDKSENTTAQDILNRYRHMRQHLIITHAAYDSQSKDFFTFATNVGEPFQKAIKDSEAGRDILNTLFKNQMLIIDDIPELEGLVDELETLMLDTAKSKARDDFIDGLRFAAAPAPWDWTKITSEYVIETPKKIYSDLELRQGKVQDINEQYDAVFGEEIEAWNELYDS
jgi:hypothetical protein